MDNLGLRGAGQTVSGRDASFCLKKLNVMIDSWNLSPDFAFTALETIYTLPSATISLTIGPAMQINIPRPSRIELGSFVRVSGNDYPLTPIDRAEYNSIMLKDQGGSWPSFVFFDGGNPTGKLYFWQTGACELHLITRTSAGSFADLTTDYQLPAGYARAFEFSLSEEVAPSYETAVPDSVARIASGARRVVKRANLTVPQLDIPDIANSNEPTSGNILGGWR